MQMVLHCPLRIFNDPSYLQIAYMYIQNGQINKQLQKYIVPYDIGLLYRGHTIRMLYSFRCTSVLWTFLNLSFMLHLFRNVIWSLCFWRLFGYRSTRMSQFKPLSLTMIHASSFLSYFIEYNRSSSRLPVPSARFTTKSFKQRCAARQSSAFVTGVITTPPLRTALFGTSNWTSMR